MDVVNYILIVILVCFSAMFSGLTLGLLGLDLNGLEIVMNGDDEDLKEKAALIKPVRESGNQLLCTLLLGNVMVNAYLSILMADITSGFVGFAVSSVAIFVFGEIIPQATCSRYALHIGAFCVPLVKVLIVIMYPVTKPITMLLDIVLGEELGTIHSKGELMELLKIHVRHGAMDVETGQISTGAITYTDKKASEVMSPYDSSYIISAGDTLNFRKITEIFKSGFSRIPVYEKDRHDIVGILLVKDLIFVDPDDETPVRNFIQIFGRNFHLIWPDDKLGDVLRTFKKGKSHIAIVRDVNNDGEGDPFYEMKGIVTLEDILEEILQDEIVDETDMAEGDSMEGAFDYGKLRLLDSGKLEYDMLTRAESLAIGAHFLRNVKSFDSSVITETTKGVSLKVAEGRGGGYVEVDGRDLTSSAQSPAIGSVVPGAIESLSTKESKTSAASVLMERLLHSCPVIDQNRVAVDGSEAEAADYVYRRDERADYMIMVLTGKIQVLAGKDKFRADAGPWTVIGTDSLYVLPDADVSGISSIEVGFVPDFSAYVASEHVRYIKITNAQYNRALRGEWVFRQFLKAKGQVFRDESRGVHDDLAAERRASRSDVAKRPSGRASQHRERSTSGQAAGGEPAPPPAPMEVESPAIDESSTLLRPSE